MITSYRQLPLGLYEEILRINADTADELERQARIIAVLDGTTYEQVLDLPLADYAERAAAAAFLAQEDKGDHRMADAYKLGGFTLVPVRDFTKLTAGQYIDFQTYTKAGYEDHIVEILSVVLVPKGHKYGDGYEFAAVQAAIRQHLCVSDALAVLAFFFVALKDLIGSSLTYSRTLAKRLKGKAAKEMLERIAAAEATLSTTAGAGPQR